MYERLIKNNINYLNKHLTRGFLETKNIYVDDNESDIITNLIKNNWKDLYNKNYSNTFNTLKNNVKKETYEKLLSLYLNTIRKY